MKRYWNLVPLFRVILPFILGISAAVYFQFYSNFLFIFWGLVFGAIVLLTILKVFKKFENRTIFGILINSFLLLGGYNYTLLNTPVFQSSHFLNHFKTSDLSSVEIIESPKLKEKTVKCVVKVTALRNHGNWEPVTGKAIIYFKRDSYAQHIEYGDEIIVKSDFKEIQGPQNPSEFDYKKFLAHEGIYYQDFCKSRDWKKTGVNNGKEIIKWAFSLRDRLALLFKESLKTTHEYSVASALTIGYTEDLDPELMTAYSETGVLHVLSVSGMHVAVIYLLFSKMLGFMDRNRWQRMFRALILISFLWFYALLTGLTPSVLRSALMLSLVIFGQGISKSTNIYNSLAASAFALLLFDPYLITDVSFQLSYLSLLGIVLIQPALYEKLNINHWLPDNIWKITTASIAAQIATFPFALLYFRQFPNYFIFSNLAIIPLATVCIYAGIMLLSFSGIGFLKLILSKIAWFSIWLLNAAVTFFDRLPFAVFNYSINPFQCFLLYLFIFTVLIYLIRNKLKYLIPSLFILLIIIVTITARSYEHQNQKGLIVYSVYKTQALEVFQGHKSILLSDSSMFNGTRGYNFHLKGYHIDSDINQTAEICPDKGICEFSDYKLALITGNSLPKPKEKKTEVDYLVFSRNSKCSVEELLKHYSFKQIILDGSNGYKTVERITKECLSLGIACHSVSRSGAFVKDFN